MRSRFVALGVPLLVCLLPWFAAAQSSRQRLEIGAQLATLQQNDFGQGNQTDYGVGARVSYDLTGLFAVEGDLNWFGENLGGQGAPFSRRRVEGLVGLKVGTRGSGARLYGMLKPGFVSFAPPSPVTFACALIYPPPLPCALAGGKGEHAFALAFGGGIEAPLTRRLRGRFDVTDTRIRFDFPFSDRNVRPVPNGYTGDHLQLGAGLGWRF